MQLRQAATAALVSVFALLSTLPSVPALAAGRPLTVEQRLSDFNQFASMMEAGYGPLRYKAEARGIRFDAIKADYARKIEGARSNAEFYGLMLKFVAEFKDSHFGAMIPTDAAASLPFATDLVEGKLLIDTIDRAKLPESAFPFAKGDEIVAENGRPAAEVLADMASYRGSGYALTALRRAAQQFTLRSGQFYPLPSGDVKLAIRRGTSAVVDEVTLKWARTGSPIDEALGGDKDVRVPARRSFDDLSLPMDAAERGFRCAGTTRVAIPKDATVIMTDPFVAYYHPTAKGNVGYLRLPEYMATNPRTGKSEFELRFAQYEYAVSVLERHTVGLIIDQDHNCGGSVSWLHRIVSLFADAPFKPMQFQLLGNKEEYLDFKQWMAEVGPNTLVGASLEKVLGLVASAWEKGEFLTPATSLDGAEWIAPHSVRYTKPIVMTIDEMSGSGGDAFPATLQGIGRAKLLGTRTMGAGGHVVETPALHFSRLGGRITKSLFFRPDGVAVENNGAEPDYPYAITRDDFLYGYRGYQAFYLSKLLERI